MTRVFIGTSGWTYDHWKEDFYPAGLGKTRWFSFYAAHFNAVEINATFYRTFSPATLEKWRTQAPEGFRYALKAPRSATHDRLLLDCEADLSAFARLGMLLGERLGMFLLQVSPKTPCDPPRLLAALKAFPDPTRVGVEFRAPAWDCPEVIGLLEALGAAWVNVDSPAVRLGSRLTGPRAYLRLHGRQRWYASNYSDEELRQVAAIVQELSERGAEEVYVFFNNDVGGYAPHNASRLQHWLNP
uniref:DUF72 domain-containing protein n=1 Tax=Anaerolinea thermolimosa TaxID=229919 RepID=A0A7C4PML1_9CHLR